MHYTSTLTYWHVDHARRSDVSGFVRESEDVKAPCNHQPLLLPWPSHLVLHIENFTGSSDDIMCTSGDLF